MRLYLVRHAQTAWNVEGRCQGHSDICLDECGESQARLLASRFVPAVPVGAVYTSDLLRCRSTAEPLAESLGVPLIVDERLRERCFGDWEGMNYPEVIGLLSQSGDEFTQVRPPNGESMQDVWDRLGSLADDLRALERSVVVVAHGGSGTLLLSRLINGTLETARSLTFQNTAVTELEKRHNGVLSMRRYNDVSHLLGAESLGGSVDGTHR